MYIKNKVPAWAEKFVYEDFEEMHKLNFDMRWNLEGAAKLDISSNGFDRSIPQNNHEVYADDADLHLEGSLPGIYRHLYRNMFSIIHQARNTIHHLFFRKLDESQDSSQRIAVKRGGSFYEAVKQAKQILIANGVERVNGKYILFLSPALAISFGDALVKDNLKELNDIETRIDENIRCPIESPPIIMPVLCGKDVATISSSIRKTILDDDDKNCVRIFFPGKLHILYTLRSSLCRSQDIASSSWLWIGAIDIVKEDGICKRAVTLDVEL